jgi:hypothetical protein
MEYDYETAYRIISTHTENIFVWIRLKADGSRHKSMRVSYSDAHTFLREVCKTEGKVPIYISGEDVFLGYAPIA